MGLVGSATADVAPATGPAASTASVGPGAAPSSSAAMAAPAPASSAAVVAAPSGRGSGATFEANLGLGWLRVAPEEGMAVTETALGGLNVGIGGWLSSNAALTLRIAGATYSEEGGSITSGFVGGALQLWANDHIWAGGGVGLGFVAVDFTDGPDPEPETGLGLDLRVGFTPASSVSHSLNFSFEICPVYLDGGTITSMGVLVGYQYL
jgi:hypothetical protein